MAAEKYRLTIGKEKRGTPKWRTTTTVDPDLNMSMNYDSTTKNETSLLSVNVLLMM